MSLAVVYSRAQLGMQAPLVSVEIHLAPGLPRFNIVGLPETVVKESKDRVRSAILSNQFEFPRCRITVNLAPADLPKEGGRFDLPIATGILAASGQLGPTLDLSAYEFAGELSLNGELKPFQGILPFILQAKQAHKIAIIPQNNIPPLIPIALGQVYEASHLMAVLGHLRGSHPLPLLEPKLPSYPVAIPSPCDLQDVKGQRVAKRALEIAAAGGHNLIFIGPPGSGKTLLASRLPSILPPLSESEAIEVATLSELRGQSIESQSFFTPPFRSPHHSASSIALVGGGSKVIPGEISMAHRGVLFLDEFPEFQKSTLEMLREPIEAGCITIARAHRSFTYPAEFQLIAAMNPCPCGYLGSHIKACQCTPPQVQRYRHKLSGPLLDRFDLALFVADLSPFELIQKSSVEESSSIVQARVLKSRTTQLHRQHCLNQRIRTSELQSHCLLEPQIEQFLARAMEIRKCSTRAFHRILRIARTIADLEQLEKISEGHLAEALQMRYFDLGVSSSSIYSEKTLTSVRI